MVDHVVKKVGRLSETPPADSGPREILSGRWKSLCSEFLPHHETGSLWRHRRGWLPTDPHQGWKIHISATILTACRILQAVGTYLTTTGAEFKAVASLGVLENLNAGIFHGYSQIGKCITIYTNDEDQFSEIATKLYQLIPKNIAAPAVPFDVRYKDGNIYYRYGSFIAKPGTKPEIRRPDGEMVADRRDVAFPYWVKPPEHFDTYIDICPEPSPLTKRYRIDAAISQRGKGGVYLGTNILLGNSQTVVIKEGRRDGETAWDGRDGRSRVEKEVENLRDLRAAGVDVPIVYEGFTAEANVYAVLENIPGENLHKLTSRADCELSPADTLYICKQIAKILADIHAAGWVWRDCKPANFILTSEKTVRPVDFEGSHRVNQPDPFVWSSPNFSAPEVFAANYTKDPRFPFAEDLYALGATLFYINTGQIFRNTPQCSPDKAVRAADTSNFAADTSNCAADASNCATNSCSRAVDTSNCAANNYNCAADIHVRATNNCDCAANNSVCFADKRERLECTGLLESIIYRLLSDSPADRPSASEVYEQICLIEAHLVEQGVEPGIVSDVVE